MTKKVLFIIFGILIIITVFRILVNVDEPIDIREMFRILNEHALQFDTDWIRKEYSEYNQIMRDLETWTNVTLITKLNSLPEVIKNTITLLLQIFNILNRLFTAIVGILSVVCTMLIMTVNAIIYLFQIVMFLLYSVRPY